MGRVGTILGEAMSTSGSDASLDTGNYIIRYRCRNARGDVALIVIDDHDSAYLFSAGALQVRCAGRGAPARLAALLRSAAWSPVPAVAPYSIDGLRCLLQGQGLCVLCSCCWRTTATGRYAYKRAGHLRPSAYLGPVDGRIRCSA